MFYSLTEHLRGVHVSHEKLFSLSGTGPLLLEWRENGFMMQIPEGALSGPCDIASLPGAPMRRGGLSV